jgi:Undecaprenyl-phosphate glucose phosphotransferase
MDSDGGGSSALDSDGTLFTARDDKSASDSANSRASLPQGFAEGATRWLDWSSSDDVFVDLVKLMDFLLLECIGGSTFVVHLLRGGGGSPWQYVIGATIASFTAITCLASGGIYSRASLITLGPQISRIVAAHVMALLSWAFYLLAVKASVDVSRVSIATWFVAGTTVLVAAHAAVSRLIGVWTRRGRFVHRIAIIGNNGLAQAFAARVPRDPQRSGEIVGIYDDWDDDRAPMAGKAKGELRDLLVDAQSTPIHSIVIALPLDERERIQHCLSRLRGTNSDIHLAIDMDAIIGSGYRKQDIGAHLVTLSERPIKGWDGLRKEYFDFIFGLLLLLLSAPFLLAIALAVKFDSPGPVLFRQRRYGLNNKVFTIYKFRTMYHGSEMEEGKQQVQRDDARVTRVGRWLRRTSLDELPQVINVLRGDMSLVGPRPHPVPLHEYFADMLGDYLARHRMKPGITGWAQVNGLRGETDTLEKMLRRVEYDLYYIRNWSLLFDLKIMLRTILVAFHDNAY